MIRVNDIQIDFFWDGELPPGINNWTGFKNSTHCPPVKDSSDQHSHDVQSTSATI